MNFFAIGNDELEKCPPAQKGDSIDCPRCGQQHLLECAKTETGEDNDMLFYHCDGKLFLAGLNGKLVMGRR